MSAMAVVEISNSILLMNDDCLCNIISYISEPESFFCLSSSCKRIHELTKHSQSWHNNIIKRKSEYHIKLAIVSLPSIDNDGYDVYSKLLEFLNESLKCSDGHNLLTYRNIIHHYNANGPVFAKLFSWIREEDSDYENGDPRDTCRTEYKNLTLHLPKRKQDMVFNCKHFVDYIGNYDQEITIEITCGDLKIDLEPYQSHPHDFDYWNDKTVRSAEQSLSPAIKILQEELGPTNPPLDYRLMVFLCFQFPSDSKFDGKLVFADESKNGKPSLNSVQTGIKAYMESLGNNYEKVKKNWVDSKENRRLNSPKNIVDTIEMLVQRSASDMLTKLKSDLSRFYSIACDYSFGDLCKSHEKIMFNLFLRTSFEPSNFSAAAVADKHVDATLYFKLKSGNLMKVYGKMHGDGASYVSWFELDLDFGLPNGEVLHLKADCDRRPKQNVCLADVKPITKLLQDCIDDDHFILSDYFTVLFFLQALEFGCADDFIGEKKALFTNPFSKSDSEESDSSASDD